MKDPKSHSCLIFIMEIPIPWKWYLYRNIALLCSKFVILSCCICFCRHYRASVLVLSWVAPYFCPREALCVNCEPATGNQTDIMVHPAQCGHRLADIRAQSLWNIESTVHLENYAWCSDFVAIWYWLLLPIPFRVTSLALGQSYDSPSASEVTLKRMAMVNVSLVSAVNW